MVDVELYGLPRLYAGGERCQVHPGTLSEVLSAVAREFPGLCPSMISEGLPTTLIRVALDGREMVDSPHLEVAGGAVLVIVSAQAGG